MSNKYPGYCIDCQGSVGAGHGELRKQDSKWVVTCGGSRKQSVRTSRKPTSYRKPAKHPLLNSAPVQTPAAKTLTEEQAAEILAKIGSRFVRPLPVGKPTLSIGYEIEIDGKKLAIGSCGTWVGQATDWKAKRCYVVSMIDGAILDTIEGTRAPLGEYTREMGAPISIERSGKGSASVGETIQRKDGHWYIVTQVDKPYYLSAEDAEDMDMFDRGGGWATPFQVREITEPTGAREKREAKESADDKQATELIAAIRTAREQILKLFPHGIRNTVESEYGAFSDWRNAPVVVARPKTDKLSPGVVERLKAEFGGLMYDRLPAMPGNEGGYYGWQEIRLVNGRHIVMHCDTSYDGMGWTMQGIEVIADDAAIIADQQRRKAIQGYTFDPVLCELLVALDKERKICGQSSIYTYFGGSYPRDCKAGAYSSDSNSTAQEKRERLIGYLSAVDDDRARQALEILQREDSISEF